MQSARITVPPPFPGNHVLRVLYLNPFSQSVSGPDESLLTLLSALMPLGVEAHVVLPRTGPQVPRYRSLGVKVAFAPLTILKRRPGPAAALLPYSIIRGATAIARIARDAQVDLIHTNMEVVLDGCVAARLLGLPHVLHYRGNTNDEPKWVFDVLTRFWTKMSNRVYCISDATAEIFRKRDLGANVLTVHNGVILEQFIQATRSSQTRLELGARNHDVLIGTIGRIHPRKDIATFLRAGALALRKLPSLRLAVIGSAEAPEEIEYERHMRSLAADLGVSDRLVWTGARRDIPQVLKALDIFVLCSRNEGFGRVVAEGAVAGVAMVLSAEGALPEVARGVPRCLFAPPGSAQAFAEGIIASATTPGGDAVPDAVLSRFDAGRIAAHVADDYARLLEARRR